MRFLYTSLLLLFLAFNTNAQSLKLVTFNCEFLLPDKVHIKYGLPFDNKKLPQQWRDERFRQQKFALAVDQVAAHLAALNADVLGLTEVGDKKAVEALVAALEKQGIEYAHWRVCQSEDTGTGQYVALLSKFPLKDVVPSFPNRGLYFEESDYDQEASTGISKGMKATVTVLEEELNVFLFHFKSERGGEESDQKRLMQAEIARRVTLPYIQRGEHVVVMGDLNSEPRHEVLLTLRGFRDIEEELLQTGDLYYFENTETRWTYNYRGQLEQLDHILLSLSIREICENNNYRQKKWGIKTTIVPTNNEEISDHNAVMVELTFKK
jgi:predicted extracellular nuclease